MILTVNIGNTNTSFGIFDNSNLLKMWKIKTFDASFGEMLEDGFESSNIPNDKIEGIIIGSVVPEITTKICKLLRKMNFPNPIIVNTELKFPIRLKVDNPDEVGSDIIANLVAANRLYPKPLVVLDSGTATTFSLLSDKSEFLGAIIAPGMELMAQSLSKNISLLPEVSLKKPDSLIGHNTIDCIRSGIYRGYIEMVRGLLFQIKKEQKNTKIVGTGGNIGILSKEIEEIDTVDEHITLKGLLQIYNLNCL